MVNLHLCVPLILAAITVGGTGAVGVGEENNGQTFTECGGVFEQPKGVISTPNFPDPYPTPIYCDWLIRAPPGKKIIIYFTQYYMKDSFYVTSYDYYQDRTTHLGQRDLGRLSWEQDLVTLVAYQPFVLIQFSVESIGNRHLRVMDFLLEVHGFNITYEIIDKNADVNKPTCSVKECSYLGNCLAAADFSKYECECFPEFFGKKCQFGPYCHPDKNINQCTNGGQCKYFFGSLINQCECPAGFAGAYCEITSSSNGAEYIKECNVLNCSHICDVDADGRAYCTCLEGYKMHENNDTCIPIARYRIDVTLEFAGFLDINQLDLNEIKGHVYNSIKANGVSTITKYDVEGFKTTPRGTMLEFHFYCMVSEVDQVNTTLQKIIDFGSLAGIPLRKTRPTYEENPELMLAEVANHDPNPTLRGSLLTLVCAAKGSKGIKFQWYKDDYAVNTSLTLRNAWEAIIPHTVHGMQLSVLNIDNVSPLDAGQFTCMASDFGETQMDSVDVKVNNYPRVQLYPMSLSIPRGQSISITCLSQDDGWLKFLYEWYRNGVKIDAESKNEYVEGMHPTGVRLVVETVFANAEYTCKVTNEAGSANLTAYVHVYNDNETDLFCPKNYEGHVMWQNTSGSHFDIKPCPTDQGVVSQYGPMDIGHAKRHCDCDQLTQMCSWLKPNFAKCQSLALVEIYDEMELLQFGYERTTLRSVFNKLYQIICPDHPVLLYSGDIDMVSHIFKNLIVHMRHFPQLVIEQERIPADDLVEILSGMLERSSTATANEKDLLLVGPNIILITNTLILGSFRHLGYNNTPAIAYEAVEMSVINMPKIPDGAYNEKKDKIIQKRSTNEDNVQMTNDVLSMRFYHLPELLTYRERSKTKRPYLRLVSRMYSMASYEVVDARDWRPITVRVHLDHDQKVDVSGSNTTICLAWNFDSSNLYLGDWTTDKCTVVESTSRRTTCNCLLPGHFAVAVVNSNRTVTEMTTCAGANNILLIVGYSLSLLIMLTALLVFIRTFGALSGEIYTVHLITTVMLTIATALDLVCVVHIPNEVSQQVLRSLLIYLYFAIFTGILAESIHVYFIAYEVKAIELTRTKLAVGCIGVPLVLVLPTILFSRMFDNDLYCYHGCWLSLKMYQMYAVIIQIICITIVFFVLLGRSLWKIRIWKEEWRHADKVRLLKYCGKASTILVLLILSITLSIDLKSNVISGQAIAHVLFYVSVISCCLLKADIIVQIMWTERIWILDKVLCKRYNESHHVNQESFVSRSKNELNDSLNRISVLVLRCILDKNIRYILVVKCFGPPETNNKTMMKSNSSSFRAYVKPEKVPNAAANQEEYNVSKYYDEINRTKYSVDRTRQLSSLLGSSVCSGESSGDTRSTTVTGSTLSSKEYELKTPDNSGATWTLNEEPDNTNDNDYIVTKSSVKLKSLEKVSSFIRSEDDVERHQAQPNELVLTDTGNFSGDKKGSSSKALSAQYSKKNNNCSISTNQSQGNAVAPISNNSVPNKNTPKPTGNAAKDRKGYSRNVEQDSIPDEYKVLIHQQNDLHKDTDDTEALFSSKLIA